jgi:hypothetical protein
MASPQIPQGTLNRLKASIIWNDYPGLNVTASFLGKEGIRFGFAGDATLQIDTMTGLVTSPEPYLRTTITVNLLKTQNLSDLYKKQMESSTLLGDGTVRPDATILSPFPIGNCSIMGVDELLFNGSVAGYAVKLAGYYIINTSLWG